MRELDEIEFLRRDLRVVPIDEVERALFCVTLKQCKSLWHNTKSWLTARLAAPRPSSLCRRPAPSGATM